MTNTSDPYNTLYLRHYNSYNTSHKRKLINTIYHIHFILCITSVHFTRYITFQLCKCIYCTAQHKQEVYYYVTMD